MTKYYYFKNRGIMPNTTSLLKVSDTKVSDTNFFSIGMDGKEIATCGITEHDVAYWLRNGNLKEVTEEEARQIIIDLIGYGKTKEDKLKLVNETAAAYTLANRSIRIGNNKICLYFLENSPGCGVGRLIADKDLCKQLDDCKKRPMSEQSSSIVADYIFNLIPADLKMYGKRFLQAIQQLHDSEEFWDEKGLSVWGIEEVTNLKKKNSRR